MTYEGGGKVVGVLQSDGGNERACEWISIWSTELKSACIIDGRVRRPLK